MSYIYGITVLNMISRNIGIDKKIIIREDRLRYKYKERYDFKDNLVDWDHQMNMIKFVLF